ncbi:DUF2188 domain-containing protein [Hymenobacter sediminis]|uniref:DUF2188 domain-containing protein n=1 Tax=Hymenobacter sediminis TaxID=2218621 RepID=UPI00192E4204|nr:DUF2188 domain-containing protein [Hymenobacter sediminis]
MAKNLHVVPRSTGWAVKTAGASRAATIVPTQSEAIAVARQMAIGRGSEMLIHGTNGQIRARNSYGNDPESSKG